MHASKLLVRWRKKNGLTMARAGALAGVDWGTWRRWETGQNTPKVEAALRIQDVTGVPVEAWREAPKTPKPIKIRRVAA